MPSPGSQNPNPTVVLFKVMWLNKLWLSGACTRPSYKAAVCSHCPAELGLLWHGETRLCHAKLDVQLSLCYTQHWMAAQL